MYIMARYICRRRELEIIMSDRIETAHTTIPMLMNVKVRWERREIERLLSLQTELASWVEDGE